MIRYLITLGCTVLATAAMAFPPPPKSSSEGEPQFPPPPEATATHWKRSQNNLKMIGLAVHNFESSNGHFPSDIVDAKGTAILSWRVQILPYIEEDVLYKQFKLDEPWDSANNKPLIEKMPKLFAPVRVQAKAGRTFYQGFIGDDTVFDPSVRKLSISNIADGTSNTVLAVEAGVAVEWSKPADIKFDKTKDLPKLGGHFDSDINMLMCDGSVRRVKKGYDVDVMKLCIMKSDGMVIDFDKLNK